MGRRSWFTLRRAWWPAAVISLATVVAVSVTGYAMAKPVRPNEAPAAPQVPAVSGVKAVPSHFVKPADAAARSFTPTKTAWPAPASGKAPLTAPATGTRLGARAAATGTPVWARAVSAGTAKAYAGPSAVDVRVLDRATTEAAGVAGVLFTVSGTESGPAEIGVDYDAWSQAYGGNYASRLRLMQYPACVLTTPQVASCRQATRLNSRNDVKAASVSAQVALPAADPATTSAEPAGVLGATGKAASGAGLMVLAAAADAGEEGGAGGTYAATDLKPSGSWTAGSSTGNFTYNYPLATAQTATSLLPQIGLGYDSSVADGQTASTQAQANWAGEGWNTPRSYIEQTFASCSDKPEGTAAAVSTYDQCYNGPILTMSLNGASTSLIWDSGKQLWKPQDDDGSVIEHVTNGGDNGSGTYNHDYWKVTARNGTVYSFGLNRLPGWVSGKPATNSVDSVPVFSAHQANGTTFTDPCYNATWAQSWCVMANRWNLDYVKDANGGAMAYYYKQDTNYYGRNKGATMTSYVRDSHVDHIDYGFTDGNAYGTVANQLKFNTGDRCVSGTCQPLNAANKANWPDVPFDLICASGATCTSWSPAFFSTVRLTSVVSQQWSLASAQYVPLDTYTLTQTIPPTGDGTSPTLWLSSIVHTGSDTTVGSTPSITLPATSFSAVQLQNRVDTVTDGLPAFYKYRIQGVTTEAGSQITVTYGLADPCTAPVTTAAATNTSSCYPVSWTPTGYTDPITDWFNKFVVTKVTETDPTGGAAAKTTSYSYLGGAAWHYDENEVVKEKYRTYGQFRGYGTVRTFTGDGVNDRRTQDDTVFYRGMSKNNNTTVVNLTDSQGAVHEDVDQLSGKPLETTKYRGENGPADSSTITSYWVSGASASRSRTGLSDLTARKALQVESFSRQAITTTGSTTWKYTQTDDSYDPVVTSPTFGMVLYSYSHTVPVDPAYDKCSRTAYAPANTTKNLVMPSEVEVLAVACGGFTAGERPSAPGSVNTLTAPTSVSRPAQVISDNITLYDDPSWSTTFPQTTAPTRGTVTMARKASDYSGGAYVYKTLNRTTYDSYGRKIDEYDGNGNKTSTAYTMNSLGLTTGMSITNALSQTTYSTQATGRGSTLTTTDINGIVTTQQWDALGRLSSVWNHSRATTLPANYKYTYVIANNGTSSATTQKLNDSSGYQTSTLIYDALLRTRQEQSMTPQGGRTVTDTFYDSHGWVVRKYNDWWDPATTPNTTLVSPASLNPVAEVAVQEEYDYDGLGRTIVTRALKNGVEKSHSTTVYTGDREIRFPQDGGVVSATVTDMVGQTVELDRYSAAPTLTIPADTFTGIFSVTGGTVDPVTYTFDSHGNQTTTTQGVNGPVWTSTFNLLGQATSKTDADAGQVTGITYDGNGNLLQQTDSLGNTTSFNYDAVNRKTAEYASTVANQAPSNQMAGWVYDNSNNAVAGMSYAKGKLTTTTVYNGGNAYVTQQNNFNVFGSSTGVTYTIPSVEGALAGTYTFSQIYTATTGLPLKDIYQVGGGLPAETVLHGYTGALDLPNTLGGLTGYSQGTTYDAFGRVNQQKLGAGTNLAYVTNTYDPHTGNLTDQLITRSTGSPTVNDEAYYYDPANNLTRQVSTRLGSTSETQCFDYDDLVQLVGAWTATDNCAAVPSTASHAQVGDAIGASSAYWTTWQVNSLGNRTQQVQHAFTNGPATDITTAYAYNGNGAGQPHTLTSTTTTGGASGNTSYTYDAAGNTATRNAGKGNQAFHYGPENRLLSITGSTGGDSSYVYDADGNILLQKSPGKTTLYFGTQQIELNTATQALTGTRYYGLPGGGSVVRNGTATSAFQFAITDKHNTPTIYLDSTAQTPTFRQYTPYGGARGPAVTAPDNHGFLNKPMDVTTGLTLVGVRQYDPDTGRFATVDPFFEATKPEQLNGYAYGGNNPVLNADPSGQMFSADDGGGQVSHPSVGWFTGAMFRGFSFLRQAIEKRNTDAKTQMGKTTVAYFDRHGTGGLWTWLWPGKFRKTEIKTGYSGSDALGKMCCERASAGGTYPTNPNKLWTRAVSWEKFLSKNFGYDNMVSGVEPQRGAPGAPLKWLSYKAVCAEQCQGPTTPSQYEPGTTGEEGGRWNGEKSRWTRTGTSMLESTLKNNKLGSALSKVNGVLEGAGPVLKGVGIAGTVITVGVDIYNVVNAPPEERPRIAAHAVGELAGGIAGAAAGAAIAGPVGAMIGGYLGAKGGGWVADKVSNFFHW